MQSKNQHQQSKKFSNENVNKFKENLQSQTSDNVLACNDVNDSYKKFWDTFKFLFDINFTLKVKKLNKNLHKLNDFMTSRGSLFSPCDLLQLDLEP
jgi:hypothetical protein